MFSPALHKQRHQFVIDYVKRNKSKKVVDLGCSECSLLKKLKFHREIELLVGVDINAAKVKKHTHGLAPISSDYLQPSDDQLRIELYQGSVTQRDSRLKGFDLVSSIELIEHLTLADVERFSEVVFGYMTPMAVIVSTPNSEFNSLFPGLAGFRHSDHKFEWTRSEFQSWALKVCLDYGYEVEFTGVGQAPPGQQDKFGFCSQIGVFHRLGRRHDCNMLGYDAQDVFSYTLLYSTNYPSLRDNNTLRRVLVSEVVYWAETLRKRWMEEKSEERGASCLAEEGAGECLAVSKQRVENGENASGTCGAEMKIVMSQECCRLHRSVSVPLTVLWSCSSRINSLGGSLTNLKHVLMDDPKVKLSQDGSAVLVHDPDQEEEDDNNLEDSEFADISQCSHGSDDQEEDWETNV